MSRVRSSMVLLGICVLALLIGALRLVTDRTPLPVGSSYSAQPDGALAVYTWSEALGASPSRRTDDAVTTDRQRSTTLVVLQPESPIDAAATDTFDAVLASGGTLVVAGDSLPWLLYARGLGIIVEPIRSAVLTASTPDADTTLRVAARYRVRADGATPLLVAPDGDWVALRMPYRQGTVVVLATPEPLTNAALQDAQTARFVYRQVLSPAIGGSIAFDEVHHSFALPTVGPATINQLLFGTAPGRAAMYAALVVFAYLLSSGRRLGPPLLARQPTETRRTMYEHVQMLADLYRRAGQLPVVRAAFSRHYRRLLAQGGAGSSIRLAVMTAALVDIEAARTESDLVAAVAQAES